MKAIPYLIIGLVALSLTVNLFLLFDKDYRGHYVMIANLVTGICLLSTVGLTIFARKKNKGSAKRF